MSEEQAPKCPLCKSHLVALGHAVYMCDVELCGLAGQPLAHAAFGAINARLAEAERANGESIDPARLQIVEKKVAQLKERGFRFAGYIMSDDIRRCTVDRWGRVEWPDFQSQAEAERLRNGLHEFLEDLEHHDIYAETVTLRAVIKRIEAILDSTEAADETGDEG